MLLEVLETFENRGPILDMIGIHDDVTHKDDLLICCNTYQQGTLKLISSGVGINILTNAEFQGIKNVFDCGNNIIGISMIDGNKIYKYNLNDTIEMNEITESYNSNEEMIYCGLITNNENN